MNRNELNVGRAGGVSYMYRVQTIDSSITIFGLDCDAVDYVG